MAVSIRRWRAEFLVKHARVAAAAWGIFRIYRRVAAAKDVPYTDQAMTPVTEDETETLELFTHNKSAREAVDHARKVKTLTGRRGRCSAHSGDVSTVNPAAAAGSVAQAASCLVVARSRAIAALSSPP